MWVSHSEWHCDETIDRPPDCYPIWKCAKDPYERQINFWCKHRFLIYTFGENIDVKEYFGFDPTDPSPLSRKSPLKRWKWPTRTIGSPKEKNGRSFLSRVEEKCLRCRENNRRVDVCTRETELGSVQFPIVRWNLVDRPVGTLAYEGNHRDANELTFRPNPKREFSLEENLQKR